MRALLILAVAALSLGAAPKPSDPVREAVVADCRLWLLTQNGDIRSEPVCDRAEKGELDENRLGHAALAITRDQDELWFAAAWHAHVSTPIRIRSLSGRELPEFELRLPEHFRGFTVHGGQVTVLTSEHVMTLSSDGKSWLSRPLKKSLVERGEYSIASPLSDSSTLYVGRDAGEWGGEVRIVDVDSGDVATVGSDLRQCGWDQKHGCAPGGQVIADPYHRGCVVADAGHDLMRLCVGRAPRLLPLPRKPAVSEPDKNGDVTVVITNDVYSASLAAADGAIWASMFEGVYRIDEDRATAVSPRLRDGRSRELPGLVVVSAEPERPGARLLLAPLRP